MDTSPYPYLDEVIGRLRQLPEVAALLEYGYNGEPLIQPPPISAAGLTDMGLSIQLQAQAAAYFRRLAYVAGGAAVSVRAVETIRASLTADDVRLIRNEYGAVPVIDLDLPNRPDDIADVVHTVMERLLLTDDQFQRSCELTQAIARHTRSKR